MLSSCRDCEECGALPQDLSLFTTLDKKIATEALKYLHGAYNTCSRRPEKERINPFPGSEKK